MRTLTITMILGVFLLSGNLLTLLGLRYTSEGASFIEKIHPMVYLSIMLAGASLFKSRALAFLQRCGIASSFFMMITAIVITLLFVVIRGIFGSPSGGEYYVIFVSILLPFTSLLSLSWLERRDYAILEFFLRVIIGASSIVGIVERAFGISVLPRLIDGNLIGYGWRAVGLMGHPLTSAAVSGLILIYLVMKPRGSFSYRVPEIIIHTVALFCFAGRTAILTSACLIAFKAVSLMVGGAFNRDIRTLPRYGFITLALILFLPLLLNLDFVAQGISRFGSADGGSADVRLRTLYMLSNLDFGDIILGLAQAQRETMMISYDIPTIEAAWVMWVLLFGAAFAIPLMISLFAFMIQLTRSLETPAGYMCIFTLIMATTSISIGSKSLLLTYAFILIFVGCNNALRSQIDLNTPLDKPTTPTPHWRLQRLARAGM